MAIILTKKSVKIGALLAGIAALGLGVNLAVLPTMNNINSVNEQIETADGEVTVMQANVTKLRQAQTQFPQIEQLNNSLVAQFPETGQTQELIDKLFTGVQMNGMPLGNLSSMKFSAPTMSAPPPPPPTEATPAEGETAATDTTEDAAPATDGNIITSIGEGYAEIEVGLSVKGTPDQVFGFLNYLNTLDRVLTIKTTSYTSSEGMVELSLTAIAYLYKPIPTPAEVAVADDGNVELTVTTEVNP